MKDKEWETTTSSGLNEEGFTITTTDDMNSLSVSNPMSTTGWTLNFTPPKNVGKYVVNKEVHFNFTHKPNWFHRKITYLLLGWEWVDIK
jgi:hypothetical protein